MLRLGQEHRQWARPKRAVWARLDPDLKAKAEGILSTLGLNPSGAIRHFSTQIALTEGLPFDVRVPIAETRKAIRNARAGKGLVRSAGIDDFKKAMKGDG